LSRRRTPPRRPPESERSLVAWLAAQSATTGLIGDDAAILGPSAGQVVTVDTQIAGVHFPADLEPEILARRLLAVNLSDLAAMGAKPTYAFLALAAPPGFPHRRFLRSLLRDAARHRVILAGGDLASSPAIHASLTLIGTHWPRARRWLRRSGARPGDDLFLGGTVGESALGLELVRRGARASIRGVTLPRDLALPRRLLPAARRAVRRHLLPRPQLELGAWLSKRARGGAIDVSDGVALDLHRLCRASRVGAVIEETLLPRAPGYAELSQTLGLDPRRLALAGGEDYVLLFTLPRSIAPDPALGCRRIGRIESGRAVVAVDADERAVPLPDLGWDHLAPARSGTTVARPSRDPGISRA
jgi:thiamine-monophosphate kinase